MLVGLRAIGSAFSLVFSRFALSLAANVTGVLLSLPLVVALVILAFIGGSLSIVPLGVVVLLGVLPNPAMMGLQLLVREMAYGQSPELSVQWAGLRDYWRVALRAWGISAAVTVILVLNLLFYAAQAGETASAMHAVAGPLSLIWLLLLLFWLGIHLYVAPLLLAQDEARIALAYRNAAVMMLSRPLASWTVILVWLAFMVFCATTGLATIFGFAVAAAMQQAVFKALLPSFAGQSNVST